MESPSRTNPQKTREMELPRTLPLAAVRLKFCELVAGMVPCEEFVITTNLVPVAVVTRTPRLSWLSQFGTSNDRSFLTVPDFDAPLEDFAESME